MNILTAYLEMTLPIFILIILIMSTFKNDFKEACFGEVDYGEECENTKSIITLSFILSFIPVVNLVILLLWTFAFIITSENTVMKLIRNKIIECWDNFKNIKNSCWNKLREKISSIFISK